MVPMTRCAHRQPSLAGALWTLPNSLVGVLFAVLSGTVPRPTGLGFLLAQSGRGLAGLFLTKRGFGAITFGRVVISAVAVDASLLRHEGHHVGQYERLGPLFIPLYLWHQARAGYHGNPFEHEAAACASHAAH